MKKNMLVLCDLEVEYISQLNNYMSTKKNVPFEVHAFTDIDLCADFVKDNRPDVLMVSEEARYELLKKTDPIEAGEVFILSEENAAVSPSGEKCVYKYQNTENILKEVMYSYAEAAFPVTGLYQVGGDISFIGVYSPVKRSLKTLFALTLGQILALEKRVLYINMEEYSGFNNIMKTAYMTDLSDIMYYISRGKPNFIWKMASITQSIGGLDYIPPALSPLDIKSVEKEKWFGFFEELKKCDYDTVILDLGEGVDGLFEILRLCDRIYTPTKDDGMSYAKLEQYEALLKIMEYDDILEKTRKLSFSEFTDIHNGPERLIYSQLGDYVREMLKG